MTTTQTTAMRNLWQAVTSPAIELTAREMALQSHNLSKDGSKATTADGQKYYWVAATERWTR